MSKPTPATYRTTNWRAYNAALKQRGSLQIWFDPETVWLAEPSGKRFRPARFTDAAIQACLTLKALFGLALRQATGLVASLLDLAGLDWAEPDFSTLSRRPSSLNVAIPYRPSTGAASLDPLSCIAAQTPAGQWTVPGSRLRAKASGLPRSMGRQSRASGGKCISGLTLTRWGSRRLR